MIIVGLLSTEADVTEIKSISKIVITGWRFQNLHQGGLNNG